MAMIRALGGLAPQVHPTAYVNEAAYVVGDVVIGAHASVWPGAVIRGDHGRISIGAYANVQDNSVVHSDAEASIGDGVVIGHRVVCHAGRVGDRVLLGNGCVVNDGAVIEDDAIVAAGAVVMERARVGSGEVWAGVPARMRGRMLPRHREMIRRGAESYAALAQRYLEAELN